MSPEVAATDQLRVLIVDRSTEFLESLGRQFDARDIGHLAVLKVSDAKNIIAKDSEIDVVVTTGMGGNWPQVRDAAQEAGIKTVFLPQGSLSVHVAEEENIPYFPKHEVESNPEALIKIIHEAVASPEVTDEAEENDTAEVVVDAEPDNERPKSGKPKPETNPVNPNEYLNQLTRLIIEKGRPKEQNDEMTERDRTEAIWVDPFSNTSCTIYLPPEGQESFPVVPGEPTAVKALWAVNFHEASVALKTFYLDVNTGRLGVHETAGNKHTYTTPGDQLQLQRFIDSGLKLILSSKSDPIVTYVN